MYCTCRRFGLVEAAELPDVEDREGSGGGQPPTLSHLLLLVLLFLLLFLLPKLSPDQPKSFNNTQVTNQQATQQMTRRIVQVLDWPSPCHTPAQQTKNRKSAKYLDVYEQREPRTQKYSCSRFVRASVTSHFDSTSPSQHELTVSTNPALMLQAFTFSVNPSSAYL